MYGRMGGGEGGGRLTLQAQDSSCRLLTARLGSAFVTAAFLKGLSHEIFGPAYWPVWMHLGLNKNRFLFLNFKGAPSI